MLLPHLGKTLIGKEEEQNLNQAIALQSLFRFNKKEKSFVEQIEKQFSNILKVKHSLLVTNCTNALKAALCSLHPCPGDIVIIPALSFIATASACLSVGLIPIPIDVDASGHLDPEMLEKYIKENPKPFAVIAVHLDGSGSAIEEIVSICAKNQIFLIEDTARSFSVTRKGKALGSFGDVGCYSFQENKILSAGEGGAIVTNSSSLFSSICAYTDHGAQRTHEGSLSWDQDCGFGENFKATELTAAVLLAQLEKISYIREKCKEHSQILMNFFPKKSYFPRHAEDIPINLWIESLDIKETLQKNNILTASWKNLFLPNHPILRERRSCYANHYPWNLLKERQFPVCPQGEEISNKRRSLPIPLQKENFLMISALLQKIL